ncbi:KRAB-A domain-containing protein 2, partial [Trichinella spiralis]|uniref:KRAB-A domain-containing protein 2 n=1 Tax=Trichinella spiralis TaxID=6334 RepID=UPI0001EFDAE6
LHVEYAKVKTGGRSGIEAARNLFNSELKLVTGRPRHPQSQGAVERLNGVVQDKLAIWMRENGCKRWSMGLKFVQWQINASIHETTGQSPFKVTFGEEPRIRLESYVLPKLLVDAVKAEEEIEEFLTSQEANDEKSLNRDGNNYEENESNIMKHFPETFIKAQKEAALGQTRAAAKIARRSKKMLIPLQIGQNGKLKVPESAQ